MPSELEQSPAGETIQARGQLLFASQLDAIHRRTDRLFALLLLLQWAAGIATALWLSPATWAGASSQTHLHVWAAFLLGGAITILPASLTVCRPGQALTRHVVAVAQMLWSALLIHLTGGRIETHFHVFGSLAILAWYRDGGVLITATVVVAADHFLRGIFWSQSVYGVLAAAPWRSVEHAGWVVFENVFLWISIRQSLQEMRELALNHAALERNHEAARSEVRKQTKELHGAEEKLRQAQKMEGIGRLAGGVAHDFNNLLTIIGGYSDLVLVELDSGHPLQLPLGEIKSAADRAASLTRQLLAFSRKQLLAPKLLNLNTIVGDMNRMLQRLIGEDIMLATHLEPCLAPVHADPGQIEQVIMNLAINARDAMPRGGKLTIETRNVRLQALDGIRPEGELKTGCYALLAITDTGIGMDDEVKAHIFEPFFTTKEVGKGTGLGLATVYGIVKQSGGAVTVYSERGYGTTFKIYLPRVLEDAERARGSAPGTEPQRGAETILLVEDEEKLRALAQRILRSSGYHVLEARDGQEALEVAHRYENRIDLLLTDVVMPHLSGRRLAECLLPVRPEVKSLYMSGYTDDAVIRHGILDAETAFIQKPFSPHALLTKVREVLDGEPVK
jgi:signal transduction histidine kinase/CheY-like chemotaxis protein